MKRGMKSNRRLFLQIVCLALILSWMTCKIIAAGISSNELSEQDGGFALGAVDEGSKISVIQINNEAYRVSENAGEAIITLVRDGTAEAASVKCRLLEVTAKAGRDYTDVSATIEFQPSESIATMHIPITDNAEPNANKTLNVLLENPVNAVLGAQRNAVLSIIDDERVEGTYKVVFDSQTGTPNQTILNVQGGSGVIPPNPEPTREGYVLENWYKDSKCTMLWDYSADIVTNDTTLYAKWIPIAAEGGDSENPVIDDGFEKAVGVGIFLLIIIVFSMLAKKTNTGNNK